MCTVLVYAFVHRKIIQNNDDFKDNKAIEYLEILHLFYKETSRK